MKKVVALIMMVILAISVCSCGSRESKIEKAIDLNWRLVHNEYISNPTSAKNAYHNKLVKWTAQVYHVDENFVDMANETSNGYPLNSIKVYLDKDEIVKVRSGQTITVVGKLKLSSFTDIKGAFIVGE